MSEKIYGIDMGTNSIKIYQKAAGVIFTSEEHDCYGEEKRTISIR